MNLPVELFRQLNAEKNEGACKIVVYYTADWEWDANSISIEAFDSGDFMHALSNETESEIEDYVGVLVHDIWGEHNDFIITFNLEKETIEFQSRENLDYYILHESEWGFNDKPFSLNKKDTKAKSLMSLVYTLREHAQELNLLYLWRAFPELGSLSFEISSFGEDDVLELTSFKLLDSLTETDIKEFVERGLVYLCESGWVDIEYTKTHSIQTPQDIGNDDWLRYFLSVLEEDTDTDCIPTYRINRWGERYETFTRPVNVEEAIVNLEAEVDKLLIERRLGRTLSAD